MECCIQSCGNSNKINKTSDQRLTFHFFPKDPKQCNAWLKALGMTDWKPTERMVLCSDHFRKEDLHDKGGQRRINSGAVPIKLIQKDISMQKELDAPAAFRVCRICLTLDSKLYHIRDSKLAHKYENITGISVFDSDRRLPQYVCWECAARLTAAANFRAKALLSHGLLHELLKSNSYIKMQDILTLKKTHTSLKSSLEPLIEPEAVNLVPNIDKIDIKVESHDTTLAQIKEEPNSDEPFEEFVEVPIETEELSQHADKINIFKESRNSNDMIVSDDGESSGDLVIDDDIDDDDGDKVVTEVSKDVKMVNETENKSEGKDNVRTSRKGMYRIGEGTKRQIVSLMQKGISITQICKELSVSRNTVRLWWDRWCREGNTNIHVSFGRRRKTTLEQDQSLLEKASDDSLVHTRDVATHLGVSPTTVRRRLREARLKNKIPKKSHEVKKRFSKLIQTIAENPSPLKDRQRIGDSPAVADVHDRR